MPSFYPKDRAKLYFCIMEKEIEFRMLTEEELTAMEADFILFLAASGIGADHWEAIKKDNPAEMQQILADFSNMVWRKVLAGKQFMEYEDHNFTYLLFFGDETTEMFRVDKNNPSQLGRRLDKRAVSKSTAMFEALEAGARFVEKDRYQVFVELWEKRS